MACCEILCILFTCSNFFEFQSSEFKSRMCFCLVWGILNYFFFFWINKERFDEVYKIISNLHLNSILEPLIWTLLSFKLYKSLATQTVPSITSPKRNYELDYYIIFLNFFIYPAYKDLPSFLVSIFPIIIEIYNTTSIKGNLNEVLCFWASGNFVGFIGTWTVFEYLSSFCNLLGIFIEYQCIIACSYVIGFQMDRIITKIEGFNEMAHYRGKTFKQMIAIVLKEVFNYMILGVSCCVVYYCEAFLEALHGYHSDFISYIARVTYCFPIVFMLRYPKTRASNLTAYQDVINLVTVGLSLEFLRFYLSLWKF